MSDADHLRKHWPDVSTRLLISSDLTPYGAALQRVLRAALDGEARRHGALQEANRARSGPVREAIHRAADKALYTGLRRLVKRRQWAGIVWRWLAHAERRKAVGINQRPCKKTIRRALIDWIPPNGVPFQPLSNAEPNNEHAKDAADG